MESLRLRKRISWVRNKNGTGDTSDLLTIHYQHLNLFCRKKLLCDRNSEGPHQSSTAPDAQILDIEVPQPSAEPSIPSSTNSRHTLTRTDSIPTYEECIAMSYRVRDYLSLPNVQGDLFSEAPPSYQEVQEQDGLYG